MVMKKTKTIAIAAIATVASAAILISSMTVFADQTKAGTSKIFGKSFARGAMNMDPQERIQKEKEAIQQKVTDGKLTQEEADKKIAELDQRIKEMQEFNNLTLDQKKEKLLNGFTTSINENVKNSKMTQEQADKTIADFKTKLGAWDGTGNPPFQGRGLMGKEGIMRKGEAGKGDRAGGKADFKQGFKGNVDPAKMLEQQKQALQQKVTDGKLTQEDADKRIAELDQKVKEMQEFNSLTLEQKKEKILSNFTTSTNDRVKDGKLTQEQADKMATDFKAKLDQWDGSGMMPFNGGGPRDEKGFGGRSYKGMDGGAKQQ